MVASSASTINVSFGVGVGTGVGVSLLLVELFLYSWNLILYNSAKSTKFEFSGTIPSAVLIFVPPASKPVIAPVSSLS